MNKQHLTAALDEITVANLTNGSLSDLWSKLPDYVAGPKWVGEIADAADQWKGYVYDDKEYQLDDLTDYVHELANGECETYYSHINKRVQDLALWAYPAIDSDVEDLTGGQIVDLTLTGLNSLYLFAAMRSLFAAVIEYAYERAAELESELTNA
jgi:hypothetical protein